MQVTERESAIAPANRIKSPFEFAAWLVDLDGTLYFQNPVRAMMAMELALAGCVDAF